MASTAALSGSLTSSVIHVVKQNKHYLAQEICCLPNATLSSCS